MKGRLNRAILMASAATSVFLFAGAALAQDTASADVKKDDAPQDEIIVTGIKGSIQNSINAKKAASTIVEAVSSEDIGKLPDVSIADSLARLPGLTAQRLDGRAQVISVRGLSPDFTTALLNGRQQVSTGDNRGVEFDQYPSEILRQVLVYKTPDASLIGQGLAGTVDLRTIRPLEYGHSALSLGARYEWNDYGALNAGTSGNGTRFTGSWVGQSKDGKWGAVIAASIADTPYQAEKFNSWGYPTDGNGDYVLGGAKPYVESSNLKRDAVLGTIEFKPNSTFHSTLDVLYSKFKNKQVLRGIEMPLYWSAAQLDPNSTTSTDGFVSSGAFTGVQGVVRNDARGRDADLFSIGWTNEITKGDWQYTLDLSHNDAKREDYDLETYSGTGPGYGNGAFDTIGFAQLPDNSYIFSHQLDYSDPSLIMLTDPQGWGQAGYIKKPHTYDKLDAIRLSAKRTLDHNIIKGVEFGVNYSRRLKKKASDEAFVDLTGGNNQTVPIPSSFLLEPTSLAFLGLGNMVSYDPLDLLDNGNVYTLRPQEHNDVLAKAWRVQEKVLTLYTQFDIDSQIKDIPVYGNFGLQAIYTDQYSSGLSSSGSGANLVAVDRSGGDTYWELLPSLNLNFELPHDQYVRLGAARTMVRARMDQMRASFQFGWNFTQVASTDPANSYWNGNGGNPKLRPWIADSIDVSYEKYFGGRKGYFSAAAFYKHLENYVYNQNAEFDFTGYPLRLPTDMPATYLGQISTPENGQGGYVRGVEFGVAVPLDMFWEKLDGFGVQGNASWTQSNVQSEGPGSDRPLEGLSTFVTNASVYYENHGWQARVSARHRSHFLGELTGFGASRVFRNVLGSTTVDGQFGYTFNDGMLNGTSLLFQVYNLTNEPFVTYNGDDTRQAIDYQTYGRTYMISLTYTR